MAPSQQRAIEAHTELRGVLEADEQLKSWGVGTVLIGSYARHTAIYPGKDVDVFVKLDELSTQGVAPATVYNGVRGALVTHYGKRAEPQHRSVKVSFDDGGDEFAVDAVPAVHMGERWGIPNRDVAQWQSAAIANRWVETDPERLGTLTTARNKTPTVGERGAYVPTVKLVRQARRHHRADKKPGGLYFEILTYWAFASGAVSGDCFAEIFECTLRTIAAQLATGAPAIDPVLGRPFALAPSSADLAAAAKVFSDLASRAAKALEADKCAAAAHWRAILGKNNRGWCFGLPEGCDEHGNKVRVAAPASASGSREASGFA